MSAFKQLVVRYANGRQICNCGDAYLTNCGKGYILGDHGSRYVEDLPVCRYGCSANQITAKEFIAEQVLKELKP